MKTLLALIAAVLLTGCGTGVTFLQGRSNYGGSLYPATRLDTFALKCVREMWREKKESRLEAFVALPFIVIDYPFSIAFDTILLPYDLLQEEPTR